MISVLPIAIAALLAWGGGAARASTQGCIEVAGPMLICTEDQDMQINDSRDTLRVLVEEGVTLSDPTEPGTEPVDALRVDGHDVAVTVGGTIRGDDEAIQSSGDRIVIRNTEEGFIIGADRGIQLDGDAFTISNESTIWGHDDAIRADNSTALDADGNPVAAITNQGWIESRSAKGIRARGVVSIVNSGTIRAEGEAIEGRDGFRLTNSGTIESMTDDAVQFGDGFLVNHGHITGGDDGVDADSGMLENSGRIVALGANGAGIDVDADAEAGGAAPSLRIVNRGTIAATTGILYDPASIAAQTVENAGVIEGTGGTAIRFAAGQAGSTLSLLGGSMIIGNVLFGDHDDSLRIAPLTSGALIQGHVDGGRGSNRVIFGDEFALRDIVRFTATGTLVRLSLRQPNDDVTHGTFKGFGTWEIGGTLYATAALDAVAPVPLPATGWMLLSGLGGLALRRRRKARPSGG